MAQQWQPAIHVVGSLAAVQGVTISAQLDGNIAKIAFEAGAAVKAGDLLVSQDTTVEQAQLRSADSAVRWRNRRPDLIEKKETESSSLFLPKHTTTDRDS